MSFSQQQSTELRVVLDHDTSLLIMATSPGLPMRAGWPFISGSRSRRQTTQGRDELENLRGALNQSDSVAAMDQERRRRPVNGIKKKPWQWFAFLLHMNVSIQETAAGAMRSYVIKESAVALEPPGSWCQLTRSMPRLSPSTGARTRRTEPIGKRHRRECHRPALPHSAQSRVLLQRTPL
jgi:hypothetical protein